MIEWNELTDFGIMGVILRKTKLGSSSSALILVVGVFNYKAIGDQDGRKRASEIPNHLIMVAH